MLTTSTSPAIHVSKLLHHQSIQCTKNRCLSYDFRTEKKKKRHTRHTNFGSVVWTLVIKEDAKRWWLGGAAVAKFICASVAASPRVMVAFGTT